VILVAYSGCKLQTIFAEGAYVFEKRVEREGKGALREGINGLPLAACCPLEEREDGLQLAAHK